MKSHEQVDLGKNLDIQFYFPLDPILGRALNDQSDMQYRDHINNRRVRWMCDLLFFHFHNHVYNENKLAKL
jgi:hypothetical protein